MNQQAKLYKPLLGVGIATALILLAPLVAMQFSPEVRWSAADFAIMGALVYGAGLACVLLLRKAPNRLYRIAAGLAAGATFLMIWANLAVGLIGSGANIANLLYAGVVLTIVAGSALARFRAAGMARTMYAAIAALVLLVAIAFATGMQRLPGSSAAELWAVNGFFALLYGIAAVLFRQSAHAAARAGRTS